MDEYLPFRSVLMHSVVVFIYCRRAAEILLVSVFSLLGRILGGFCMLATAAIKRTPCDWPSPALTAASYTNY